MSSIMDVLQQLNDLDLCVMCHNYGLAVRYIKQFDRRNLERRLHVAVIGERARHRAHNLMYRSQYDEDQSTFDGEPAKSNLALSWHGQRNLRNHQRFGGGFEPDELETQENQKHTENLYEESMAWPLFKSPESKLEQRKINNELQLQVEHKTNNNPGESHLTRIEHCIEWTTKQQEPDDYFSIGSTVESRSSILATTSKGVSNQLHYAERFSCWEDTNICTVQKSDTDANSEQELCTVNYLSNEPPIAVSELNVNAYLKRICEHSGSTAEVDTICPIQCQVRQGPAFWRHVLSFNSREILNSMELRYAILCCAVVAWVYIGVKMMQ